MVEISSFKGYIFNSKKTGDISKVIAPPWDVIDEKFEEKLQLQSPYNIINLISKNVEPADVSVKFHKWIKEEILIEEKEECFYFVNHKFKVDGEKKERKGFFALLKLEEFEKGNVIPHEKIFEKYKMNRYKLIEKCRANFSPVFMLYRDENFIFEKETEGEKEEITGRINDENFSFGKITDRKKIERIRELFKNKKVIIADGHHRYNAALHFYLDNPYPWAEKVLVFFVNINSPGLVILPTHRYIQKNISFIDKRETLGNFFEFIDVSSFEEMKEKLKENQDNHTFGVYEKGNFFILILKRREVMEKIAEKHSKNWSELDTVILHEFIFTDIFKIKSNEFLFHSSMDYLMDEYRRKKEGVIFFLNPIKKEQFLKICYSGEVMPHKSTYFYPKVPSGLVIYKFPV